MKLDFDSAKERRVLADGRVVVDVLRIGEVPVMRVTHAPGWRWSVHSASASGTERCANIHVGVMTSGRMMVELLDGTRYEARPGDALAISPGHDAWTVGDEPAVLVQIDEGEVARARYRL
jgi:quercetin dioxygenase-like cupin family protein